MKTYEEILSLFKAANEKFLAEERLYLIIMYQRELYVEH